MLFWWNVIWTIFEPKKHRTFANVQSAHSSNWILANNFHILGLYFKTKKFLVTFTLATISVTIVTTIVQHIFVKKSFWPQPFSFQMLCKSTYQLLVKIRLSYLCHKIVKAAKCFFGEMWFGLFLNQKTQNLCKRSFCSFCLFF